MIIPVPATNECLHSTLAIGQEVILWLFMDFLLIFIHLQAKMVAFPAWEWVWGDFTVEKMKLLSK